MTASLTPSNLRPAGPAGPSVPPNPPRAASRGGTGQPSESAQLREFIGLIRRNRWVIALVTILAVGIAAYFAFTTPATYRAVGAVLFTNDREAVAGKLGDEERARTVTTFGDPIKTQLQMLTSRGMGGAVIDRMPQLRLVPASFSPSLLDTVAVVDPGTRPQVFEVRFTPAGVTLVGSGGKQSAPYGTQLDYIGVRVTFRAPPAKLDKSLTGTLTVLSREQGIAMVVGGLKAVQRPESDVIDIEYRAADPYTAQRVVNTLIESFRLGSLDRAQDQSRRRRIFVQEQLRKNDSSLAVAEQFLSDFRVRAQTFGAKEKYSAGQRDLSLVEAQRLNLASDRTVFEQLLADLRRTNGAGNDDGIRALMAAPNISANPVIPQLYGELSRFEHVRDSLTTGPWAAAKGNPDVVRLDSLIVVTRGRLVNAAKSSLALLDGRLAVLESSRIKGASELRRLPEAEAEEMRLSNQVESLRKLGEQLREQVQKAGIAEAVQDAEIQVVDMALLPQTQAGAGPAPKLLVALLVGLLLGVGAGYVRENLDTAIRRREDVEKYLDLPILALIPRGKGASSSAGKQRAEKQGAAGLVPKRRRNAFKDERNYELVNAMSGGSELVEALVTLRTNLLFSHGSTQLKRLVVSSPAPRDGKTSISCNLAVIFASHGQKVLLVDADLRRPRVHDVFGVQQRPGLTEVLTGAAFLGEAVQQGKHEKLRLLTAGRLPSNPSQFVGSEQLRELLAEAGEHFDLVIIDAPPILAVSDAALMAKEADGVLMVIRAGTTDREEAQAARDQITSIGGKILGVVLNDPDDVVPQFSAYYYNYYNYYTYYSRVEA